MREIIQGLKIIVFRVRGLVGEIPYLFFFEILEFFHTRPPTWSTLILRHPVEHYFFFLDVALRQDLERTLFSTLR
jgi:hypothetical protein